MACEPSCGTRRRDILRLATVPPTRGQQQIGGSRTHKFRMQFPQCKNQRTPKNRRISTIRLQDLKYSPGNCMRNCKAPHAWRAAEGPDAVPVGGGRAWATHRQQAPPDWRPPRGLAGLRDDAPISGLAPLVWRAPEGPEGTGGLRGAAPNEVRPPSLAGGPPPTGTHSGRALRRPEHQRGHKQRRRSGGQATRRPEIWRGHKHRRTEKPQNSS